MNRGKGYRKDPEGHRKTPFATLRARRGIPADAITPSTYLDMLDAGPPALDQGNSGACVGHALSRALAIRFRMMADPLPWLPSPLGIYTVARCLGRDHGDPLVDEGSEPNEAIRGIGEWGVRPMGPLVDNRLSDCDPATINAEPSFADLEADAALLAMGAYAITSSGAAREQELRVAMFHGFPVTVAVDASEGSPIQNYGAGVIDNMGEQLDHYVALDAFRTIDGALQVRFGNSWGPRWGENGGCWLGSTSIQQLGDLWVIDIRKVVNP